MKRPSIYAPLSAHYFDDEAVMEIGEDAELMFVRMLAYAARIPEAEGHLPRSVCLNRLGFSSSENDREKRPENRLEKLRESGLVSETPSGYQINSWLRWNPSASQMGRERERDRRRKKPAVTRSSSENDRENDRETDRDSRHDSHPVSCDQITDYREDEIPRARTRESDYQDDFDTWWQEYPRKESKGQARKAYKAARKKTSAETLLAAIQGQSTRLMSNGVKYCPHPSTWLNGERWNDELSNVTHINSQQSEEEQARKERMAKMGFGDV